MTSIVATSSAEQARLGGGAFNGHVQHCRHIGAHIGALELDTGNVSGIVTKSGLPVGHVRVATVALVPRRGDP